MKDKGFIAAAGVRRIAFTLAEMLIVLLIVSVMAAVTLPVMTKKRKSNVANPNQMRVPIGAVMLYAGTTEPPEGWLVCDGSVVNRPKHAKLREVLGSEKLPVINNMPIGNNEEMLHAMQQMMHNGEANEETLRELAQRSGRGSLKWIIRAE